jgi:cardiolipin synthase A/B
MLTDKVSEGVDVRIIGTTPAKGSPLAIRKLPGRLHARAIMRDGESAFLGSMSLRKLELEARREIGVIIHDAKSVKQMIEVFDKDWKNAEPVASAPQDAMETAFEVSAKKVAKSVAKKINVGPVVEQLLDKVADSKTNIDFQPDEMAQTLREAFREEVHDAVVSALHDMAEAATEASNGKDALAAQSKGK